jgi:hypothetical protein
VTTEACGRRIEAGVEPGRTSQRERYAMQTPTNMVRLRQPGAIGDPLTEVLRTGARRLLAERLRLRPRPSSPPCRTCGGRMGAPASGGTGMARSGRSRPASAPCRSPGCFSGLAVRLARRIGFASPQRYCRSGRAGVAAWMRCSRCCTGTVSPPATFRRRSRPCWARMPQPLACRRSSRVATSRERAGSG